MEGCIGWTCILSSVRVSRVNPRRHNATLHALGLGANQFGDVGAVVIGEGLRCVHTYRLLASMLWV
jgi:hypothetical protein